MAEGSSFPPGLSAGEKAVIVVLESIALGLCLTPIEMMLSHGASFWAALPFWILGAFISYVGFKWPEIKPKIKPSIVVKVEGITSGYRFKIATLFVMIFVVSGGLLFYLYSLRSDLDAYVVPRVVTMEQAEQIRAVLLPYEPHVAISVVASAADHEAIEYASQLTTAFNNSGWEARIGVLNPWNPDEKPSQGFSPLFLALDQGVIVRVDQGGESRNPDPRHPTPDVLLGKALRAAHLESAAGGGAYISGKSSLILEVGRRPVEVGVHSLRVKMYQWIYQWLSRQSF